MDAFGTEPALERRCGPCGQDPAVVDDRDVVGELVGFVEVAAA